MQFQSALFVFRRDLRLEDNIGLRFALKNAKRVVACFIFTPEQIEKNPYRGDRCLQFLIESLEDLGDAIHAKGGKLHFFYGKPEQVVAECIRKLSIEAVVCNRDYTPYSVERDRKIARAAERLGVPFLSFDDALLHAPEETLKPDGKPYSIFTPFYKRASKLKVAKPERCPSGQFEKREIPFAESARILSKILKTRAEQARGGRKEALKLLKGLERFSKYAAERDYPAIEGTTHLSPHLKFTTCSPREIYYAVSESLGKHSPLIRSLYWRDFFTSVALHFPHVFGSSFHKGYDRIRWSYDRKKFGLWTQGKTGFPIVDAGMRELNETGYMHNRVRMIAASFLVKDLHIDWRWGEKYFAQTLIDYDPAVNNGNWQWSASTGCDAQPYFRIFNPWAQQKKFDPECEYIKRWIPELKAVPPEELHAWHLEKSRRSGSSYPAPCADHACEAKKALASYRKMSTVS